jgi:hypothetical protein
VEELEADPSSEFEDGRNPTFVDDDIKVDSVVAVPIHSRHSSVNIFTCVSKQKLQKFLIYYIPSKSRRISLVIAAPSARN